MEKLTIAGTFQKSVDALKNTVCSQKDKLHHFNQLSECIQSPHFHVNHFLHTSTAISVLLLFCEDTDPIIRMNAEENLCKIIRHCENGNIPRVQVDLYHEIKKNGNDRSLRICLNIFSHYCPQIKQRKARSYAQNLLQCIASIARRKETLLLEALMDFIKVFCEYLQCNVMDNELVVVLQIFLDDLSSGCAVKRRCSAQNLVTFIKHSRKTTDLADLALSKALEILMKQPSSEATVGVLGFIRLIIPVLPAENNCDLSKLLEVYEICLGYLQEGNHSIINASLEVLNMMTSNPSAKWREVLIDTDLMSKAVLLKKRGLIKSLDVVGDRTSPEQLVIEQSPDEENIHMKAELLCESLESTSLLVGMSDVESESLQSMDIKTDFTETGTVASGHNPDGKSLKSQNSTDSIGSFFNSLLTNPLPSTTETVTNFFRGQKSNESSVTNTPKIVPRVVEEAAGSPVYEHKKSEDGYKVNVKNSSDAMKEEDEFILEYEASTNDAFLSEVNIEIGTIFDQSVISYTVRLIASKFILSGERGIFLSDQQVRVSIKNLSLTVIANCILLSPQTLVQPLEMESRNELIKIELEKATEEIEVEMAEKEHESKEEKSVDSEGYLEMKDDHFGKSGTSYKDYFTPLAKNVDSTLLGQLESWTMPKVNLAPKINRDLSALLTKASGQLKVSTTPSSSTPRKLSPKASNITQYLTDILQLHSHPDPIIRSDIIQIVSNFVKCLSCGLVKYDQVVEDVRDLLKFPKLIEIVVQGLSDENHTVVRQALAATDNILPYWLLCGLHNTSNATIPEIISVNRYLGSLLDVNDIKYWTVQSKYSEVLANLDFHALHELLGHDVAAEFETICLEHIISMLGDEDGRIRNAAAKSLSQYTLKQSPKKAANEPINGLRNDICGRILQELPPELNAIELGGNAEIDPILVKVLYILSNKLITTSHRESIVGVLSAIKELSLNFKPGNYYSAWNEFNFLGVVIKYIQENSITIYDLTAHSDALELCTSLLAAKALHGDTEDLIEVLLIHLLKLINVYHHIFTATKVITLPKGQKSDIFLSGKDTMKLNNLGYFGNDFVYVKLYRMLKIAFDSRKITIDREVSGKMMILLSSCLKALTLVFDIKPMVSISQSTATIEEILTYLMSCVNYQPKWCVLCTKHMLRHFFDRNFVTRRNEIRQVMYTCSTMKDVRDIENILTCVKEFTSMEKKNLPYEDVGHHLKIFEPMVIHSLRLFMKANSSLQSIILELLCQLLDFKVNYYLLDANNVFIEYILRHLEIIETGCVRKCEMVICSIFRFLFHLCKQSKEKKIITIPKIINITDNLLANSNIRVCSIRALVELGHELFFNCSQNPLKQDGKGEWNTEREVVFTMMLKFLDYAQVQRAVALIVLSQRNMDMSYEIDAFSYLLTLFRDEKFTIDCEEKFNGVTLMFHALQRAQSVNDEKLAEFLSIFPEACTSPGIHYNKLTRVHLLFSHVILSVDEVCLINCIKLHLVKMKLVGKEEDSGRKVEHEDGWELNYFAEIVSRVVGDSVNFLIPWSDSTYSALLEVFLGKLCQLANFNTLSSALLAKFVQGDFIQLFYATRTICPKLFIAFMNVMIHLNHELYAIIETLCRLGNSLCDRQLRRQLCIRITEKYHQPTDWQPNTIQLLLQSDLPAFLRDHHKFLRRLCNSEMHANGILALVAVCHTEFHSIAIDNEILKLIDKSHHSTMVLCLRMLLGKFLAHPSKSVQQRALAITVDKLDILRVNATTEMHHNLPLNELSAIVDDCRRENLPTRFPTLFQDLQGILQSITENSQVVATSTVGDVLSANVDEQWYSQQILHHMRAGYNRAGLVAKLLMEIKSEMRLSSLVTSREFSSNFLCACLRVSFDTMQRAFQMDCVQHSPHMTYLKVPPLLKFIQNRLEMDLVKLTDDFGGDEMAHDQSFRICLEAATCFIENVSETERICLIYVDGRQVEKYIGENLLRPPLCAVFLGFATRPVLTTLKHMRHHHGLLSAQVDFSEVEKCLKYIKDVLHHPQIWQEFDSIDKHHEELIAIIELIRVFLTDILLDTKFLRHHSDPDIFSSVGEDERTNRIRGMYMDAIFVARFIEEERDIVNCCMIAKRGRVVNTLRVLSEIATAILRVGVLYPIAMTPFILLHDMGPLTVEYPPKRCPIPSIPIEQLNDSELLPKFISRLNLIGFSTRQQFEEIFMSLLVLLNSVADPQLVDAHEEYFIKTMCLGAISELLVTCKMFPRIGFRKGEFHHSPRLDRIKMDNIGVKKLHKILNLIPGPNVFYYGNLERNLLCDRIIGTQSFAPNQFSMNFIWQIVEENVVEMDTTLKSVNYFVDQCGIDFRSTVQLIYDVFAQLIDQQCTQTLVNVAKLSDICENRDQCKWIKNTMQQLQERIPLENTVAHQYIIYLLCKSHAILVPSLSDLTHLCSIIPTYLKSTHVFVRNAALNGLLCLLESAVNTNTSIGALSEEIILLRNIAISYINKNGVTDESTYSYSDMHTKLVWTLTFYLIEKTSKFVPDCTLLSNLIISGNNILKKTTNLHQYLCIVHGMQRLIITNSVEKVYREKIEKVSLDLVKCDNEEFSIPALKLLISCMYIGSASQLENTEHSNGIVQDEPEVIVQSTEKIDVLFLKIKSSTPEAASIIGDVLCQITRDLLPPNEILTKVIKELLSLTQPHGAVVAKIVFQVFRSAIDSAYMALLQDWLICSLPNFVTLPPANAVSCLSVIFVSASLNLNLIKIFPEILETFGTLGCREEYIFHEATRDFYGRLSGEQKDKFRSVFFKHESSIYANMLKNL